MEHWKDIIGYEGKYQVSNYGNIRALHYNKSNRIQLLKQGIDKGGYLRVALCHEGTMKTYKVHRLVAQAFLGDCRDYEINHIDGNKRNNKVCNLEIVTKLENMRHSWEKLGRKSSNYGKRGGKAARARRVAQHLPDGKLIATFDTISEAAEKTKISFNSITDCCKGRRKQTKGFIFKYINQ